MNKIILNNKNLVPDSSWLYLRKVRAIIENQNGEIIICKEAGKYIFPGGKCDGDEPEEAAVRREIREETGIILTDEILEKALEIEAFYDDFFDYRTQSLKPRHMLTTYFYIKTDKDIDMKNLKLTAGEEKLNFNVFTCDKNNLYKLLKEQHLESRNGKFFDEENMVVLNEILLKKNR